MDVLHAEEAREIAKKSLEIQIQQVKENFFQYAIQKIKLAAEGGKFSCLVKVESADVVTVQGWLRACEVLELAGYTIFRNWYEKDRELSSITISWANNKLPI